MSKEIKEYDENNNLIYYKDTDGYEYFYKHIDRKQIEITQKEFEQIKRDKEFIQRKLVSRFELMDI